MKRLYTTLWAAGNGVAAGTGKVRIFQTPAREFNELWVIKGIDVLPTFGETFSGGSFWLISTTFNTGTAGPPTTEPGLCFFWGWDVARLPPTHPLTTPPPQQWRGNMPLPYTCTLGILVAGGRATGFVVWGWRLAVTPTNPVEFPIFTG